MKSYHEKYKGFSIMRGMFGNGSYDIFNALGHLVGNAESLNLARQKVDKINPIA